MIEVNNLTTNQIDREFLKKVAKIVLIGENKKELELSIVLVGQARIRKLNKKYRKKNQVTDVLSFLYDNSGEIVICLQEVKKNAKNFQSAFKKELARVLIHGILHLLGSRASVKGEKTSSFLPPCFAREGEEEDLSSSTYDHKKSEKAGEEEKQEHYLRKIYG